jgi:hypothetical protein
VAPGIAGAPDADLSGINFGLALEKRNRAPPIGDLLPRVDVPALCTFAGPEIAIVDQHVPLESGMNSQPRNVMPPSTPNSIFLLSVFAICFSPYACQSWTRSVCELYRENHPSEGTASMRYRSGSLDFV